MGHSIHAEVMLVLSFYIIAPGGVKLRLTGFAEAPLPAELSFQPSVLLFKIYFIYLGVYIYIYLCLCVCTLVCGCPQRPEEGINHQELGLQAVLSSLIWALGTELKSSRGVASTLSHSPVPPFFFFLTTGIINPKR